MRAAISIPDRSPDRLARVAFASAFATLKINGQTDAEDILKQRHPKDAESLAILKRAIVGAANTSDDGWAASLATTGFRAFLAGLGPISAASRLIDLGLAVEMGDELQAVYPVRNGGPASIGWVHEMGVVPVVTRAFGRVTVGPRCKVAVTTVFTGEMARRSDAESTFTTMLREDTAATLDLIYFSTSAGGNGAHAGLLNGLAALPPSTAGGKAAMQADLAALAGAVAPNGSGQIAFIMSSALAAIFPISFPEVSEKVVIFPSAAVPADRVIAVDPLALLHATAQEPDISASRDTVLHMEDTAPDHIGTAGTPSAIAAPVQSTFQTDQVALRLIFDIAFAKRRSNAVAYIDGVDWE